MNLLSGFEGMFFAAINHRPMATQKKGHWGFIRYMLLLGIFDENSALGLKTSGMPRAREVSIRFVFGCFCIFRYWCVFTRVEKFGLAKGDGGEGEVATDEDHVGDAQGGQQVVEYVVHFPSISEIFRIYI